MSIEAIEHCARAVVQYLSGDMNLFQKYTDIAMEICEEERCICSIGEMIPKQTRKKLYEMVS